MSPPKDGRCLFGRQQHRWATALRAALAVNEPRADLSRVPEDVERVYWCHVCGRVETPEAS